MRVAVVGAPGQLGSDLVAGFAAAGDRVTALGHADLEVADIASVRAALGAARPELVLDAAAFHPLGRCEEDPGRAFAVNALGARNVARAARELGAGSVYFSTDYVFDGRAGRPYTEEDPPRPLSVYGATKLAGEHLALAEARDAPPPDRAGGSPDLAAEDHGAAGAPGGGPSVWVIRIAAIYGRVPSRAKGDNFLTMITRRAREQGEVRVVDDEIVSPTPTTEIARATREIVAAGPPGLYHLACRGSCSWYELTGALFSRLGIDVPVQRARVADFPGAGSRPAFSALASRRYEALGGAMPHWREALERHLASSGT